MRGSRFLLAAAVCSVALNAVAWAEIEKLGEPCDTGLCLHWWPKLPMVRGWHREEAVSRKEGINALAPDGAAFDDSDTVMYASAVYRPGSDLATLEEFIEADQKAFLENSPATVVSEVEPVANNEGRKFRSFTFFPQGRGNWEQVTFGEEGDYFLVFTLSSRSRAGYDEALPAYLKMLRAYKEKY